LLFPLPPHPPLLPPPHYFVLLTFLFLGWRVF